MTYKRTCKLESCGAEFQSHRRNRVFCSHHCQWSFWHGDKPHLHPIRTCAREGCDTEFKARDRLNIYCSLTCKRTAGKAAERQKTAAKVYPVGTCLLPECNAQFDLVQPAQQFCSTTHQRRHARRRQKAPGYVPVRSVRNPDTIPAAEQTTIKAATGHGYERSGYSESKPREATTSGPRGCSHCRAAGRDLRGNIIHSNWCREAEVS